MATSPTINIEVANPPAPVEYAASGINALTANFESVLAMMKRPKLRRLTHEDQVSRYPTDEGFRFADEIGRGNWRFWSKSFLKSQK